VKSLHWLELGLPLWIVSTNIASERQHPFVLATKADLQAARQRAQRFDWARESLNQLISQADAALARPVEIPDRGGQWTHWYACKKDGSGLKTVSPTEHRCPTCGAVYRGEPYDSIPITHLHGRNSQDIFTLGLAYGLTDERRYADRAVELLMGYVAKYPGYKLHDRNGVVMVPGAVRPFFDGARVGAQTLDEAVWLIPVVQGFDLVWDRMDQGQREQLAEKVLRPSAETIRAQLMGIHNIQCWKNSAVGLVGLVLNDEKLIADAIDEPTRGFRRQIEGGVTKDGLWYEGSLGYHAYTMSALWPLAVAAGNAGVNLFSDRYRLLYEAPIRLALPDGSSPGFNDSAGGAVQGLVSMYDLAYARWDKPIFGRLIRKCDRVRWQSLLWGADRLPGGNFLPTESDNLPVAGYAMLRTSPADGRIDAVAVRYGMHGGGHGHPDKLNIVMHGAGELLAVDPGSISYGAPLHREWYRTTIAHNTVCVDQTNQKPVDGKLEEWHIGELATRLSATAADTTPGVLMRRSLGFRSGPSDGQSTLSDRFEVTSDRPHTYDWAFHCRGRLETDLKLSSGGGPPGTKNGYQHIRAVRQAQTDEDFTIKWTQGKARLTLKMKGSPGTTVFIGEAPGRSPTERVPMIIVRRRAAGTTFEATLTVGRI
jgi:hypothetical protein